MREFGRVGEQQNARGADAARPKNRDPRSLKMAGALAINILCTRNQPGGIDVQTAHAGAGDEPDTAFDILRPMRQVNRALGAFDAAPHASSALSAGLERTIRPGRNRVWGGPPMPAEPIMR